jgi:hypothetical protein
MNACDFCDRKRFNKNDTNWKRHTDAYKKKKVVSKKKNKNWIDFLQKYQKVQTVIIVI